jgi:hypothetical protein
MRLKCRTNEILEEENVCYFLWRSRRYMVGFVYYTIIAYQSTVGAQSIARLRQNYDHWLNSISKFQV